MKLGVWEGHGQGSLLDPTTVTLPSSMPPTCARLHTLHASPTHTHPHLPDPGKTVAQGERTWGPAGPRHFWKLGTKGPRLDGGPELARRRTVKGSSISQLNAARLLPTLSPTPCHLHAPCLIYPGDPASLDPWEQVSTYPLMAEGFLGTNPQQRFKSLNSSFLVLILLQKMSPLQYAFSSERLTRHSYTVALHSEKPRI